VFKGLNNRC